MLIIFYMLEFTAGMKLHFNIRYSEERFFENGFTLYFYTYSLIINIVHKGP